VQFVGFVGVVLLPANLKRGGKEERKREHRQKRKYHSFRLQGEGAKGANVE
jgi:hypothetical protein